MSDWSSLPGGSRVKLKIIFLGDQSVGKSSVIDKYIKEEFEDGLNPTVGIDFHIKNITYGGKNYRLQLWDTAGQERFKSLIPSYLKDANCAVLVFDISKAASLENIKSWEAMFEEYRRVDSTKVLVGNKVDLNADRAVSSRQAEKMAAKCKAKYIEVSAKTGENLEELFELIIQQIEDNETKHRLPMIEEEKPKMSIERNIQKFKINIKNESGDNVTNKYKKQGNDKCC